MNTMIIMTAVRNFVKNLNNADYQQIREEIKEYMNEQDKKRGL